VIQERDGNNTPTLSYTRGNDLSVSLEGAGGIGGLLARSSGYSSGTWTSHADYFADGNGNITSLIDANQNVVASYRYDPFGNIISKSGSLADANVYRFSSKEVHINSGMYYYGFRFYDPNMQRWINRDPIEEEGGINLSTLTWNDPLNLVDVLGLHQSPTILLYLVPGQGDWDNAVTSWQNGQYGNAVAWGGMMLADQALFVATFGRCNASAAQVARRETAAAAQQQAAAAAEAAQATKPALRQAYEQAVRDLGNRLNDLRRAGKDPEAIARELSQTRRALGEKFKDMTPANFREKIYQRNLKDYGDPLGPTVDYLRAKGKTWEQIAESACRSGGQDFGF
jgi:RHS repeat-associated protein